MAYGYSEVFTGPTAVGQLSFDVNPFSKDTEEVYLNGIRLVRYTDYTITSTNPADPNKYERIQLDQAEYPNGFPDADDVLEVVTDYLADAISDPIFATIIDELNDIKTATMGSWIWDKREDMLTMYDTNGVEKFKYSVGDTAERADRERRQDLESN